MTEEELEQEKQRFFSEVEEAIELISGKAKEESKAALQKLYLLQDTYVFNEAIKLGVERRKKQAH